jgi:hypothetical protein
MVRSLKITREAFLGGPVTFVSIVFIRSFCGRSLFFPEGIHSSNTTAWLGRY